MSSSDLFDYEEYYDSSKATPQSSKATPQSMS